jgi:hypothetical protein
MIFRWFSHFLGIDLIDFGFSKIEKRNNGSRASLRPTAYGPSREAACQRSPAHGHIGRGGPSRGRARSWLRNRRGEHEGEVVSASGNSLAAETHRGGVAPVRAEGRVAQRGSTVAEVLRRDLVAPRQSCDAKRE